MRCVTRPFADTDRITCMEDPFSTAFRVRLPRVCGEMLEAPQDPTSGRAADRLSRQLVPELRQPRHLLPRRCASSLAQSVRPVPVGVFELLSLCGRASGPSWYRSVTSTASPGCNSASSFATIVCDNPNHARIRGWQSKRPHLRCRWRRSGCWRGYAPMRGTSEVGLPT
jgi:hypothetical protein